MAQQFPSIQSFFERELSPKKSKHCSSDLQADLSNGFTEEEIRGALYPKPHKWIPHVKYEYMDISSLIPGPGCVALVGRVVNFYDQHTPSKKPQAAKGCFRVVIKDDTGSMMIRLWYAKVDYELRLGQLVSIWTPHISNAESGSLTMQNASLVTSIFPERDNTCCFIIHESSNDDTQCKTPFGYQQGKQLAGLMTLKSFAEGGYEVTGGKILVCVKSIGGRKKLTNKKGQPIEKVDVNVFDDTLQATLTLWSHVVASAVAWKPSHTILLITSAGFRGEGRPTISINATTQIEVNPEMCDVEWLRAFAERLIKREHVNQPFPEKVFDIVAATSSEYKILFTLAELDQFVRGATLETCMGYLSLIITDLNITKLHQRNMLCCTECCGVPVFANFTSAECKQCGKELQLRLNPRLVGMLVDETGNIACGKLIWSDTAWEQLLGRTAKDIVEMEPPTLMLLEHRILFLRVTLLFGWSSNVGRLTVCEILRLQERPS